MSDKDSLIAMGFPEDRVTEALKATKNAGLQPALDFLVKYPDGVPSSVEDTKNATQEEEEEGISITDADANSLKCDDCGKMLRNADVAQVHATRTGHQNFSQSTDEIAPLTEEEKKQKLAQLQDLLAEKRKEKAQADAAEAREREKIRRHTGQDISLAKEKQQELEMKKALEDKRREKEADRQAKLKIKAQIEADKQARIEKAAELKRIREGLPQTVPAPAAVKVPVARVDGSSYAKARIQIRVPNGPALVQTFPADQTLQESVYKFVENRGYSHFVLSTSFPRCVPSHFSFLTFVI